MSETGSSRLTLVGTVHRDRQGESKLLALLNRLRPTEITLELSPTALGYRRERSGEQLRRLDRILARLAGELGRDPREMSRLAVVEDIRSFFGLPFEYRASAAYAAARAIPLGLIDLPEISALKLRRVEKDLVTYRNLRVLVNLPPRPPDDPEGYLPARSLVLNRARPEVRRAFLYRRRGREGVGPRDRLMAEEIRQRLDRAPAGRLVHIGGWVHLVEDDRGETLYSRLADLAPRRMLLE